MISVSEKISLNELQLSKLTMFFLKSDQQGRIQDDFWGILMVQITVLTQRIRTDRPE